jgi:hypothetical protein
MSTAYSGDGITFPDNSVQATAPRVGMVNRIINGDMRIDQRNAGAAVTAQDSFPVDRFKYEASQASKFTLQQNAGSVTPPVGFINYLGATSSSAYSITATDYFVVSQKIEGLNAADLAWGTASAATVTLSFKVYSSLTGTFGGAVLNSAQNRSYPFSYSIPTANTWTTVSITIPGDTSGTWLTTNGTGIALRFSLGVGTTYSGTAGAWAGSLFFSATGATSVVGTSGATFYITGVQLEKGSTATDFEYVDYGRQLQMCQRYYETSNSNGTLISATGADGSYVATTSVTSSGYPNVPFIVGKRATPTLSVFLSGSGATWTVKPGGFYQQTNHNGYNTVSWTASAEL